MSIKSVLFVCTGNICRSPTAEGILRHKTPELKVGSAGTHGYHIGSAPDSRSIETAASRGVDISGQQAQKFIAAHFDEYDLILAMDEGHYHHMKDMADQDNAHKVHLFCDYVGIEKTRDVPDPYYGSNDGFDHVFDLIEDGIDRLLKDI